MPASFYMLHGTCTKLGTEKAHKKKPHQFSEAPDSLASLGHPAGVPANCPFSSVLLEQTTGNPRDTGLDPCLSSQGHPAGVPRICLKFMRPLLSFPEKQQKNTTNNMYILSIHLGYSKWGAKRIVRYLGESVL